MAKCLIWCEVACSCCGGLAQGSGYYSPERIKRLKAVTKDWTSSEEYPVLCPACQEEIKTEEKEEQ